MLESKRGAAARNRRLLLVDDDAISREIAEAMLRAQGHDVDAVDSGAAAIELFRRGAYDAIVLDVNLADMSGYDVAARVRQAEAGSRPTPILIVSASAFDADRARLRAVGVDACVGKPLDEAALAAALTNAFSPIKAAAPAAPAAHARGSAVAPLADDFAVRALVAVVGAERARQIQDQFWSEWPAHVTRLCSIRADKVRLAEHAHRLTALAGNCGFLRLSLQCRDLMVAASSSASGDTTDDMIGRVLATGDDTREARTA